MAFSDALLRCGVLFKASARPPCLHVNGWMRSWQAIPRGRHLIQALDSASAEVTPRDRHSLCDRTDTNVGSPPSILARGIGGRGRASCSLKPASGCVRDVRQLIADGNASRMPRDGLTIWCALSQHRCPSVAARRKARPSRARQAKTPCGPGPTICSWLKAPAACCSLQHERRGRRPAIALGAKLSWSRAASTINHRAHRRVRPGAGWRCSACDARARQDEAQPDNATGNCPSRPGPCARHFALCPGERPPRCRRTGTRAGPG
jgi:hypothetical protein